MRKRTWRVVTLRELHELADKNEPPCRQWPDAWAEDDGNPTVREYAMRWCRTCPIMAECFDYAVGANEEYGIWGGVDMTTGRTPVRLSNPL